MAAEKNGKGERKMGQREHRMKNRVREQNYDMLRVISMVCIMLIHIGDDYGVYILEGEPFYYFSLGNICLTLTTFAVPCFLMISGAFILSDSKNRDFKLFYKKSLFHMAANLTSVLFTEFQIQMSIFGMILSAIFTTIIAGFILFLFERK